jgi:hypothetical protein
MSTCSSKILVRRKIILSASNESDRDRTYLVWPNLSDVLREEQVWRQELRHRSESKRVGHLGTILQPHGNITKTKSVAIPPSNGDA